jgi:hypothetical protein
LCSPHLYCPEKKNYKKYFDALPGYKIISAEVVKLSNTEDELKPLNISSDGKNVTLEFSLKSGSSFDRWRGWLKGNIVTTQERIK